MKTKSGFSIVELIIATAVIVILAAAGMTGYTAVKNDGDAAAAVEQLLSTEKSFKLFGIDAKWTAWPSEAAFGGAGSAPPIQTIIDYAPNSYLKSVMPSAPSTSLYPKTSWVYDYDADTVTTNCNEQGDGANITILNVTADQALAIDKHGDDGNVTCGKIQYDSGLQRLYYNLSKDGVFDPTRR